MTTSQRHLGVAGRAPRRHTSPRPGLSRGLPPVRRPAVWLTLAVLTAVASCAAVLPLKAFGGPGPESGTVFAHLSWGAGDGEVGLVQVKEGLTRGPEALAVTPDGRVAILDSVNGRLVLLDAGGQPLGTIELDLAQPRFLAADDQTLYVLDCDEDGTLATLSWSGDLIENTSPPETDESVTGLFATSEGPCVEFAHEHSLLMAGGAEQPLPGRPVDWEAGVVASASYRPSEGVRLHARSRAREGLAAEAVASAGASQGPDESRITGEVELRPTLASGAAIEHLVSLDSDGTGGLLIGARLVRPETRGRVTSCLAITRLPSNDPTGAGRRLDSIQGAPEEMLLLDESGFAYLGAPYVVAPDGRIFQPIADKSGYTILVHSFEEVRP